MTPLLSAYFRPAITFYICEEHDVCHLKYLLLLFNFLTPLPIFKLHSIVGRCIKYEYGAVLAPRIFFFDYSTYILSVSFYMLIRHSSIIDAILSSASPEIRTILLGSLK